LEEYGWGARVRKFRGEVGKLGEDFIDETDGAAEGIFVDVFG
jgi:hypothetical protein